MSASGVMPRPHLRGEVRLPRLAVERAIEMARLYRNWPLAMRDRLGLAGGSRQVLYRLRSPFGPVSLLARANGCDVRTITEIWIGEMYDRLASESLARAGTPIVVDIGANCGYFSVYMARKYPGAQLLCFEPEPDNRSLAIANMALNAVSGEVRELAVVADDATSVTLHLADNPRLHTAVDRREASSHGIETSRYSGRVVEVKAININDALRPLTAEREIDFLKIDVEGLEVELLMAISTDILRRIRHVSAEVECGSDSALVDRLRSVGFDVVLDAGLVLAARRSEESDA